MRQTFISSQIWKEEWNSLPERTEVAWYRKVMEGELDSKEWAFPPRNLISLVIRPDMSVYRGKAGIYGASYGNLRSSTVEAVVKMAIANGETTDECPIYFSVTEAPKPVEAALVGGDPDSQKVHLFPRDAYTKWLDVALAAYRRY